MEQQWLAKKSPTLYLLDIAIYLALFHQITRNNFVSIPQILHSDSHSPVVGLEQLPSIPHLLHDRVHNFKTLSVLETHLQKQNDSLETKAMAISNVSDRLHVRNVTLYMVLVSPLDVEEDVTLDHVASSSQPRGSVMEDPYNFEDNGLLVSNDTIANNSSVEQSTAVQNFTNADDVRWRQYINANDSSVLEALFDTVESKDDIRLSSFTPSDFNFDTNSSTFSMFDKDGTLNALDRYGDLTASNGTSFLPSTSKGLNFDSNHPQFLNNSLNVDQEDADVMQILYEQDVDLGYSWNQNKPVKQLKEVDDMQKIKNDSMNINDFFIDGETGEQIPISRTQQAAAVPTNTQLVGGNNAINIDECLQILEHSIEDIQPRRPMSQASVDERNSMVQNLTSLLQPTNNASQINTPARGDDIWQQIDHLSELTGMDLQGVNQPIVQQAQNLNGNYNFNGQLPSASTQEPRNLNEQYNYNFNGMGSVTGTSPSYEPSLPQTFPISTFPTSNSPIQTPPNYMQSPLLSDDGIPMDTNFVQIEPSNKEPSYPLNNFNNFSYQMDSSLNGGSPLSSLPEPGQGFFDYLQQDNNMNSDFASSSTSLASLSSSSSSPFLNPPVSTYPPPPLDTPSSSGGFVSEPVMSSSIAKCTIESYESDSGISLDQSPRGFDLLTLNQNEEVVFNTELTLVKPDPALSEQERSFSSPELNAINHNHTYNGTIGVKKQEKKKVEKSHPRESRDEKKARELNIPFTLDEIILSPVEEYNEMLARTPLNPAQQALVKDIRRRGKNKVAAQNCRKRKIETISNMEEDVEEMRSRKQQLVDEQKSLEAKFESMKLRYSSLYQQIFSSLRDDSGRPYDPSQFRLEQVEGAVLLVPRQMQDGTEGRTNGEGIDFTKVKMEENL